MKLVCIVQHGKGPWVIGFPIDNGWLNSPKTMMDMGAFSVAIVTLESAREDYSCVIPSPKEQAR